MTIEQTLRFNLELNSAPVQSNMSSFISQLGQQMQGAYEFAGQTVSSMSNAAQFGASSVSGAVGSAQLGYGYTQAGLGGTYGSIANAHDRYRSHMEAMSIMGGVNEGVAAASQQFSNAMTEQGGVLPSGATVSSTVMGAGHLATTVAGWSAVNAVMPGMKSMFRAGSGMARAVGFGGIGGAIGGVGLLGAGMMLPYMAVDAVVDRISKDITEQQQIASALGSYSQNVGPLFGIGGSRLDDRDRYSMARSIQNIGGAEYTLGTKGVTSVLDQFGGELFRGNPNISPDEFRKAFSEKLKLVKDFSLAFDQSVEEAGQTIKTMRYLGGVRGTTDPRTLAAMIHHGAGTAGLTTTGMVGIAQSGAQQYMQLGMSHQVGIQTAVGAAADIGTMQQLQMASAADIQAMGGTQGAAQLTTQMRAGFMAGPMGQMLAAAALSGGKIDPNIVSGIISGKIGTGDMLSLGAGLAGGGLNSLSDFYANREKYASQINAPQQQGLQAAMAVRQLQMVNMPVTEENLITVLRQQMPIQMARITAAGIVNPEIYQQQINATYNQVYQKSLDREGKAASWSVGKAVGWGGAQKWGREVSEGFRDKVSTPIGEFSTGIGEAWQRTKDRWSGTARYRVDKSMYDYDKIFATDGDLRKIEEESIGDLFNTIGKRDRAEQLINNIISRDPFNVPEDMKRFQKIRDAYIDTRRSVIPSMRDSGFSTAFTLDDQKKFIEVANRERNISRNIISGMSGWKDVIKENEAIVKSQKFNEVMSEIHSTGLSGVEKDPTYFANLISSRMGWGEVSGLSSDKQKLLGAILKDQGFETNERLMKNYNISEHNIARARYLK